jgi:hypothetical protein
MGPEIMRDCAQRNPVRRQNNNRKRKDFIQIVLDTQFKDKRKEQA